MTELIDYRTKFLVQYTHWITDPLFKTMEQTVEASPWHREANVLVHTDMVVEEYCRRADMFHDTGGPDVYWDHETYLGAVACAFHDVGKPAARTEKFSEKRGVYYSYPGHELISARLFEDFAVANIPDLTPDDIFCICWIIEVHMPWEVKDKTKRRNMALTAKSIGIDTVCRMMMSDQVGRISDDFNDNIAFTIQWIEEFRTLCDDVFMEGYSTDAPIMWLPIAPSGAGKSTCLKKIQAEEKVAVFSLDVYRHEFYDPVDYAKAFQMSCDDSAFMGKCQAKFREMIKTGMSIYVDNTNTSAKRRKMYVDEAHKAGYCVIALLMPTKMQTLIDRQLTRGDKNVPPAAVVRQYMSLQLPNFGEVDLILNLPSNME